MEKEEEELSLFSPLLTFPFLGHNSESDASEVELCQCQTRSTGSKDISRR